MKVTVCFGRTRVVVPCGDGTMKIHTLVQQAVNRYKRAIGKDSTYWVCVHRLEHSDGGILDLDDTLCDVIDDKDRLVCVFEEECPVAMVADSNSGGSAGTQSPALSIASDLGSAFSAFQPYGGGGGLSEIEVTPTSLRTIRRRSSDPAIVSVAVVSLTEIPQRPDAPSRRKKPTSLPGNSTPNPWTNQKTASEYSSTNQSLESGYSSANRRRGEEGLTRAGDQPLVDSWLQEKEEDARIEPVGQDDSHSEHTPIKSLDDIIKLVEVSNDGGPLGIHVVPFSGRDRRTLGLLVRRLESGGKAEQQGLFREEDCIVRINNADLRHTHFTQAQMLFRHAMRSPLIQFHVVPKDKKLEYERLTNTHTDTHTEHTLPHTLPHHEHNTLLDNTHTNTHTEHTLPLPQPHREEHTLLDNTHTPTNTHTDTLADSHTFTDKIFPITHTQRETYTPTHTLTHSEQTHTPTHTLAHTLEHKLTNAHSSEHTHEHIHTHLHNTFPLTHTHTPTLTHTNNQSNRSFYTSPPMDDVEFPSVPLPVWARPMGKPPLGLIGQSGSNSSRSLSSTPTGSKKMGRKMSIQLRKGPEGLGFSLTSRETHTHAGNVTGSVLNVTGSPAPPLCVKKVLSRGAANQDGRLKVGDRILQVNGLDVSGRSQEEVVSLLRATPLGGVIRLVVLRQQQQEETTNDHLEDPKTATESHLHQDHQEQEVTNQEQEVQEVTNSSRVQREVVTLDISLDQSAGSVCGLGVSIKGNRCRDTHRDLGIFVKNIVPNGAAYKDGRLRINDRLLCVNGESLLAKSNQEAMMSLRQAMSMTNRRGRIELVVARREDGGVCVSPSPENYRERLISHTGLEEGGVTQDQPVNHHYSDQSPASSHDDARLLEQRERDDLDLDLDLERRSVCVCVFEREGFGRQSVSEKRSALNKSKSVDLDQARRPAPSTSTSMSLDSLSCQSTLGQSSTTTLIGGEEEEEDRERVKSHAPSAFQRTNRFARGRGCNESFRQAMDKSYERIGGEVSTNDEEEDEGLDTLDSEDCDCDSIRSSALDSASSTIPDHTPLMSSSTNQGPPSLQTDQWRSRKAGIKDDKKEREKEREREKETEKGGKEKGKLKKGVLKGLGEMFRFARHRKDDHSAEREKRGFRRWTRPDESVSEDESTQRMRQEQERIQAKTRELRERQARDNTHTPTHTLSRTHTPTHTLARTHTPRSNANTPQVDLEDEHSHTHTHAHDEQHTHAHTHTLTHTHSHTQPRSPGERGVRRNASIDSRLSPSNQQPIRLIRRDFLVSSPPRPQREELRVLHHHHNSQSQEPPWVRQSGRHSVAVDVQVPKQKLVERESSFRKVFRRPSTTPPTSTAWNSAPSSVNSARSNWSPSPSASPSSSFVRPRPHTPVHAHTHTPSSHTHSHSHMH